MRQATLSRGKPRQKAGILIVGADHSDRLRRSWRASCWSPRWPTCPAARPSDPDLALQFRRPAGGGAGLPAAATCCTRASAAKSCRARRAQLKTVAGRLEASLKNAAAINARLNQSEARYKGLVDAQGDAIFRRDAASRLTYGNDAFFKLFGLDPARAIGYPFAPEPHPRKPRAAVRQLSAGIGPQPRPL